MIGIYCILNVINGKRYIGSSAKMSARLSNHKSRLRAKKHHSHRLQRAFDKYGEGAFHFAVIECCEKEDRVAREQIWLNLSRSWHPDFGYNIRPIAEANDGIKFSQETKDKIRAAHLGRKFTPDHRAKLSFNARNRSPETRAKISDSIRSRPNVRLGTKHSEESRAKIGAASRNRSPEANAKIGAAGRGRKQSPEARAKNAASQLGRKHSAETRAKISAASRRYRDSLKLPQLPSANP